MNKELWSLLGIKSVNSEGLGITRVRPHHFRIGAGPKQTTFTKITLNPNGILSRPTIMTRNEKNNHNHLSTCNLVFRALTECSPGKMINIVLIGTWGQPFNFPLLVWQIIFGQKPIGSNLGKNKFIYWSSSFPHSIFSKFVKNCVLKSESLLCIPWVDIRICKACCP